MDRKNKQGPGADIRSDSPSSGGEDQGKQPSRQNNRNSSKLSRAEHETSAPRLVRVRRNGRGIVKRPRPDYLKHAGYRHIRTNGPGRHILQDIETGYLEEWEETTDPLGIIYRGKFLKFRGCV